MLFVTEIHNPLIKRNLWLKKIRLLSERKSIDLIAWIIDWLLFSKQKYERQ